MSDAFWSSPKVEPKRANKWVLYINEIPTWIVKKVGKPGYAVTEATHKYLNHTFYYPGRVEWQEIALTLVDPVDPDASEQMIKKLRTSGYIFPTNSEQTQTISKVKAVEVLGSPRIVQIDPDGQIVEEWTLYNAWVKSVKFGELDYEQDNLTNIEITLRYDWANLTN